MYGPLYFRQIELEKSKSLKLKKGNFDAKMQLSAIVKKDLNWWNNNITSSFNHISRKSPTLILYTDSSLTGWGAVLGEHKAGDWSRKRESQ